MALALWGTSVLQHRRSTILQQPVGILSPQDATRTISEPITIALRLLAVSVSPADEWGTRRQTPTALNYYFMIT